jgi:hypothetical protein
MSVDWAHDDDDASYTNMPDKDRTLFIYTCNKPYKTDGQCNIRLRAEWQMQRQGYKE